MLRLILTGMATLGFALGASAATVSGPRIETGPGQGVVLPIAIASGSGEDVSGVQFDLVFDPALLTAGAITAGSAATDAGKILSTNEVARGQLRIIVAGLNQTVIDDGELLLAEFVIEADAAVNAVVAIERLVLSDPSGRSVRASAENAVLLIDPASAEGEPVPAGPTAQCGCASRARQSMPSADLIVALLTALLLTVARRWSADLRQRP